MGELSCYFFGPPRIRHAGKAAEPDTRKAVALLAYLAITGQPHTRDSLAALLYPEYDEPHARGALRRTLSSLNKALGTKRLSISREQIALIDTPDVWVDTRQFEALLAQVDRHTHTSLENCQECQARLEQSADLYRGDFLAGFSLRDSPEFDDWKFFQSESLRRRFSSALERLSRNYRLRNQTDRAIETARRWLALDPLVEDAHRELMRAYAQAGQRNAALRQYNECARILEKELGVEPLEETRTLYREILEHRYQPVIPAIPAPLPAAPPPVAPPPAAPPAQPPGAASWLHEFPLIGRGDQWQALLDGYRSRAGKGFCIALEGEPGIGKTRLAEELLAHAARQGAVTLTTRCFEGESALAYAAVIELLRSAVHSPAAGRLENAPAAWLSESARLLGDLRQRFPNLPEPPPLSSPGAQSVFFEGLRQTLFCLAAGDPPGIIFIDDAHWADSATLDLLAYLVRRLAGHAVLILVAWREGEQAAQTRLGGLLAEAQRSGHAGSIHLERLNPEEVAELTRSVIDADAGLPEQFNHRLFAESEGLPLVLVEYLEAFLSQAPAGDDRAAFFASESAWQAPENVRELFLRRLNALDEVSRQLLTAGAVIGRSFDFETLAATAGYSQAETIAGLEKLVAHGLVQECSPCDTPDQIRYDFTHEKLRSLVYAETSQVRRRLLHGHVADSLAVAAPQTSSYGVLAGQAAQHYRLAGNAAAAARYYRIAADEAGRLYANRQALELYQAALEMNPDEPYEIHARIGDLLTLLGEYDAALEAYRRGQTGASAAETARLAHKIGGVLQRRGEWQAAIEHYRHVLDGSHPGQEDLAARCLADWSLALMQTGQMDEAEALAQQALQRAETGGAGLALAQAHNLLGILLRRRKQFTPAYNHLKESLDLGMRLTDESVQAAALNNLALLYEETGDSATAIDYTQKALALCEKLGDRHRAAALHNHLADLYQHNGFRGLAMEHLKQAVMIFAEIGGGIDEIQPEIWKLSEW